MKNKNYFLSIALSITVLSISTKTIAQTANQAKLEKNALAAFQSKNYDLALSKYLILDSLSSNPYQYDYMVGMCYLSTNEKDKALSYLITAKDHGNNSFVVNYYLGRAYLNDGNFLSAVNSFKVYSDSLNTMLSEINFRFRKTNEPNEKMRVHIEKSLSDVNGLVAQCEAKLEEYNTSFATSEK